MRDSLRTGRYRHSVLWLAVAVALLTAVTVPVLAQAAGDAPVCDPDSFAADPNPAGTVYDLDDACFDPENDALSYTITDPPDHGSLSAPNGQNEVTYTPAAGYSGPDSFKVRASDGTTQSAQESVISMTVRSAVGVPECFDDAVEVNQPDSATIDLRELCFDEQLDPLSFEITDQPDNAKAPLVVRADGRVTFTPAAAYGGPDSFSFRASDAAGNSNIAAISLTVDNVNDPPTCENLDPKEEVSHPLPLELDLDDLCTDDEGEPLTYTITASPSRGSLSGVKADGTVTFSTSSASQQGDDSFSFKASDGTASSNQATVPFFVDTYNHWPECYDDRRGTNNDDPVVIGLAEMCEDDEENPLTFTIIKQPSFGGTVSAPDSQGRVTFTPHHSNKGTDTFSYRASDGTSQSINPGKPGHAQEVPTVVTVDIDGEDDRPLCQTTARNADAVEITIDLDELCQDDEGDALAYQITTPPANGSLTAPNGQGQVTYNRNPGFRGRDSFQFKASDAGGASPVAIVTLDSTNEAPECSGGEREVEGPVTIDLDDLCADPEGGAMSYTVTRNPAHGSLSAPDADNRVTYAPAGGYNGGDGFRFTASDGTSTSPETQAVIYVDRVDDAPACTAGEASVNQPGTRTVDLGAQCADDEGSPLTFTWSDPPHGSLQSSDPSGRQVTYTPDAGYSGPDSFRFIANDGANASPGTRFVLRVDAVGPPPPANATPQCSNGQLAVTQPNSVAADLDDYCSDDQDASLAFAITDQPDNGTLTAPGPDNRVTYTPRTGYSGADSFGFRATDPGGKSGLGALNVTVSAAPAPPPPPPPPPPPSPPPPDTTPPSCPPTVPATQRFKLFVKGLQARVTCTERATLVLRLVLDGKTAKRVKLTRGVRPVTIGTVTRLNFLTGRVVVKPTAKAARALKVLRTFKVKVQGTAVDARGNRRATPLRTVTVKR